MTTEPVVVDARGQKCPLPVLKAEKALAAMQPGQRLVVLATDPMARVDIPHFCGRHGYEVTLTAEDGVMRFEILR